jgi:hypothetical protein
MSAKTRPKTAKPLAELAREHGISRETLRAWRDSGIDIHDPAALAARIASMTGRSTDETMAEAKRRRAIADANRAELIAAKEAGKLVELAAVHEVFSALGAEMKARLLAMRHTLVEDLTGRPPEVIARILDERIRELLASIFDNSRLPTS